MEHFPSKEPEVVERVNAIKKILRGQNLSFDQVNNILMQVGSWVSEAQEQSKLN